MTDIERIVAEMSVLAKAALTGALPNPTLPHELWTPDDTADLTLVELDKRGLIWRFTQGSNPLTPLGLALRQHLLQQEASNG